MEMKLQIAGAILALSGFAFGLYQFHSAQKWKRAEFAAAQLERLQNDPLLSVATRVLDWRGRQLPLPESLRLSEQERSFGHAWPLLAEGVKPELQRASFTREMEIYRDLFDALFGYFDEINHYVDIKLVSSRQVATLKYWLIQVANPRFGPEVQFGPYLRHYGFPGTIALMKKFEVNPPHGSESVESILNEPSNAGLL